VFNIDAAGAVAMAPLIVMGVAWVAFRLFGSLGLKAASSWVGALRFALAAMFAFTAVSHFLPGTRPDLVRMVPPGLPNPEVLVTITGVLELLGALGLLVPAVAHASAYALIVLLVAMFPANIHAARTAQTIAGRPATPLAVRLPLQLFWIGALWRAARSDESPHRVHQPSREHS
jgi:uncharacterized membrane protein